MDGSYCPQSLRGFTLIELVTVMVVISIVSVLGFGFVQSTMKSYISTVERGKLITKGRASLERMARQLRGAVPNSVRVTGRCVEFLPVAGGGNYIGVVPDVSNGAAASTVSSVIPTAPHSTALWTPRYVLIGAMSDSEIYASSPASLANLQGRTATTLTLTAVKEWQRNSLNNRFFLADNPQAFCVSGTDLRFYPSGYATPYSSTGTPSSTGDLLATDVSGTTPFILSPGTEDRSATLAISITFLEGSEGITLNQEVLIRNVP